LSQLRLEEQGDEERDENDAPCSLGLYTASAFSACSVILFDAWLMA